jgi:hypothetical protein
MSDGPAIFGSKSFRLTDGYCVIAAPIAENPTETEDKKLEGKETHKALQRTKYNKIQYSTAVVTGQPSQALEN